LHHLRRTVAPLALALAVALTASACSGGPQKKAAADTTRPTPASTTTTVPAAVYPLTGLPATDATRLARPVLWVKIDNAPKARPQTGLGNADVVFEEMVEGGLTRFMAAFQSADADPIGPVRSVRPVDPDIVSPLGGLFAYSGGAPKFVALLHHAPIQDVGADADGGAYFRDRSRSAPDNQYSRTSVLYQADRDQPAARPLFEFLAPGQQWPQAGVVPAPLHGVTLSLPRARIDWDWDPTTHLWLRSTDGQPHVTTDGGRLAFTNVLLQFVPYVASHDVDSGGNSVPYGQVIGEGTVWYMVDGQVVQGHWSKTAAGAATDYTDATGAPMKLVPGRTFVELAPTQFPPVTR
jgi:Protein of unknown function (DUF3048) N-terminal domain/Protein of unknown function (DUF3048) C-terminal domain